MGVVDTVTSWYIQAKIKKVQQQIEAAKQFRQEVQTFQGKFSDVHQQYESKNQMFIQHWEGKRRQTYDHACYEKNGAYVKVNGKSQSLLQALKDLIRKLEDDLMELKRELERLEEE